MEVWECYASAKINLALDVLRKREDGYHDLKMLMFSLSLQDKLTLRLRGDGLSFATSNHTALPPDRRNIALRAALLYWERTGRADQGLSLHIDKRIPVSAGLGGGSSDAAAVLRLLNSKNPSPLPPETLADWALELGSDVPYCLRGGLCLAEGRGERLQALPPLPPCFFVLCTPPVAVSTRAVFSALQTRSIRLRPDWQGLRKALEKGDLPGFARRMYNVLEPGQSAVLRELPGIRSDLLDGGALGVMMSGTGPTMFGLFDDENKARAMAKKLRSQFPNTFFAKGE